MVKYSNINCIENENFTVILLNFFLSLLKYLKSISITIYDCLDLFTKEEKLDENLIMMIKHIIKNKIMDYLIIVVFFRDIIQITKKK